MNKIGSTCYFNIKVSTIENFVQILVQGEVGLGKIYANCIERESLILKKELNLNVLCSEIIIFLL